MTVSPIRRNDPAIAPVSNEMPSDLRSEDELLGAIIFDPEAFEAIAEYRLTPEMFYYSANQSIFEAFLALYNSGKSTGLTSLAIYLKDQNLLEKIGGVSRLRELSESVVSAVRIDACAESIRDKFLRRRGYRSAIEASQLFLDTAQPLQEVLDAAEHSIFTVKDLSKADGRSEPESVAELLDSLWYWLDSDQEPSLKTGFLDLDDLAGGLFSGDLIVAAGRASMGKSHYGVAQAYNVAKIHNKPAILFSLEMEKLKMQARFLALHSQVDSSKILEKKLSKEETQKLAQATVSLAELPIEIDDTTDLTIADIRAKVRRISQKYKQTPALIVIDYVQLMGGGTDNRVRELDLIIKGLKVIAKEFKTTVLALAQVNREVEKQANKRPSMADIRESGAFEMHPDRVIFLYRDGYYNPENDDGRIELIVAKNRSGKTGKVKMLFNPQYSQFRDEVKRY